LNLAFLGTQAELTAAFEAAGWTGADPLNPRTFAKTYSAFAGMRSYARAPVSTILYEGRTPDLVFQKSFNTLARRHHIRLWKKERPGFEPVWLGAATHDVGIVFDWNRISLTHRIDPLVDRERSKVMNDLTAAACLRGIQIVDREFAARGRNFSDDVQTDGALWAARVGSCQAASNSLFTPSKHKRSRAALSARRVILETRHYLTRGSAYHYAYQSVRWAFFGHKGPEKDRQYAMALK
jgi:LssY C-terminus